MNLSKCWMLWYSFFLYLHFFFVESFISIKCFHFFRFCSHLCITHFTRVILSVEIETFSKHQKCVCVSDILFCYQSEKICFSVSIASASRIFFPIFFSVVLNLYFLHAGAIPASDLRSIQILSSKKILWWINGRRVLSNKRWQSVNNSHGFKILKLLPHIELYDWIFVCFYAFHFSLLANNLHAVNIQKKSVASEKKTQNKKSGTFRTQKMGRTQR